MCAFACVRTNEINAIHENEKPCSALVVWLLFVELPFLFFTQRVERDCDTTHCAEVGSTHIHIRVWRGWVGEWVVWTKTRVGRRRSGGGQVAGRGESTDKRELAHERRRGRGCTLSTEPSTHSLASKHSPCAEFQRQLAPTNSLTTLSIF